MKLLALDTTSAVATAAVFLDGVCLLELEANPDQKHAETVLLLIDRLLEEAQVSIREIDCFAVDIGPGSFTGVRIGVSAVKGMAHGAGKPCVGVDALEAKLAAAGVRYEAHRYLAHHAFANETAQGPQRLPQTQYDAAWAEQAWDRTMRFFGQHLG